MFCRDGATSRQKKIYSTCDEIIEQLEEKV